MVGSGVLVAGSVPVSRLADRGWLSAVHVDASVPVGRISWLTGVSPAQVQTALRAVSLAERPLRPALLPELADTRWLHDRLVVERFSASEVAQMCGCAPSVVHARVAASASLAAAVAALPPRPVVLTRELKVSDDELVAAVAVCAAGSPLGARPGAVRKHLGAATISKSRVYERLGRLVAEGRVERVEVSPPACPQTQCWFRPAATAAGSSGSAVAGCAPSGLVGDGAAALWAADRRLVSPSWLSAVHVDAGLPVGRISWLTGVSPAQVRAALSAAGVDERVPALSPHRFPELHDVDWMVARLVGDGLFLKELAALVGCDQAQVCRVTKQGALAAALQAAGFSAVERAAQAWSARTRDESRSWIARRWPPIPADDALAELVVERAAAAPAGWVSFTELEALLVSSRRRGDELAAALLRLVDRGVLVWPGFVGPSTPARRRRWRFRPAAGAPAPVTPVPVTPVLAAPVPGRGPVLDAAGFRRDVPAVSRALARV